jgi:hypothetical protein
MRIFTLERGSYEDLHTARIAFFSDIPLVAY